MARPAVAAVVALFRLRALAEDVVAVTFLLALIPGRPAAAAAARGPAADGLVAKAEVRVVDEEGVVEAGARDAGLPSLLTAAGAAAAGLGGWAAEFKLAVSRLEAATEVGTAVTSTLCACALRPDMLYEAVAC